jgi:hypothetical protein
VAVRHLIEVALGIVGVVLCSYALWQVTDWLANRRAEDEAIAQLLQTEVNTEGYRQNNAPRALSVGTATAVPAANGFYDLVAEVKNPNIKWGASSAPFTFTVDGMASKGETFFLPLEEKYVVKLAVPLKNKPKRVELKFDKFNWQRIRKLGELPIPIMDIKDEKLEPVIPQDESTPIGSKLSFILENTSPYSYWQVGLTVVLSRTGSIQAVGQQVISDVESQGTRRVEFYWPGLNIVADNFIVKPEVNVLDPRILK